MRFARTMGVLVLMSSYVLFAVPASALDVADARHLLLRTGFGAPIDSVETLRPLSREEAVAHLLDSVGTVAVTPPPSDIDEWYPAIWYQVKANGLSAEERTSLLDKRREQTRKLKAWWYQEMLVTPSPMTEVLTLFWHNHFTSSNRGVQHPVLMYRQNRFLRANALGNFGVLLQGINRDPAMMLYLQTVRNHASAPNENYARELLELFTLGEGHYTEADVRAVARSFTGWLVDQETGSAVFRRQRYDAGDKTIFGQTDAHDTDSVVSLLLDHPRTAAFIVEKFWRSFVSDEWDPTEIERISRLFRESDYDVRTLVQALLTSNAFWSEENRGVLIKSPVELLVGTTRQFGLGVDRHEQFVQAGARLGQDLLDPPNVAGWPGGMTWISSDTLLARDAVIRRLVGEQTASQDMAGQPESARALDDWVANLPAHWQGAGDMVSLLLPFDPIDTEVLDKGASGALLRRIVTDPAYQLK